MDVSIFVETTFDDGETKRRNICRLRRASDEFDSENLGLFLDDAKSLLRSLQEAIVQDQVGEAIEARRKCDSCAKQRAIHDDRGRILDTLFGRIRVKWPRLRRCLCQPAGIAKPGPQSPIAGLFSDRATPELRRLQAELGARHSFREAARLIEMFLPCSAQSNTTVRNRLGRVADELGQGDAGTIAPRSPLTVFLDGAHIRSRPEYQKRHLDVVVGKVESANVSRRFGLVQQAASSPAKHLRHDLITQGWNGQSKVTVISDGEPALPNLVRRAVRGPVTHILDWWHISMRVKHIENAVRGLLQSRGFSGLPLLFERPADSLRWYLWHGKVMTAATILKVLQIDCDRLHTETRELRESAKRVRARCQDLYSYLANNFDALVDYGHRHRNGLAVSSSRAEGCVDDIGNTRMGKRRRMRWSPRGAHRVAVTRAAVLDGRLGVSKQAA